MVQQGEGRAAAKLQAERHAAARGALDAHNAKMAGEARLARQKSRESMAADKARLRSEAEDTIDQKNEWRSLANARRQEHLDKAKATKDAIAEAKAAAARKKEAWMERKRAAAREEKANDSVATAALADEVSRNAARRRQAYNRRYVPVKQVESLDATDTFRKLYNL